MQTWSAGRSISSSLSGYSRSSASARSSMLFAKTIPSLLPSAVERRRFQRVRLDLGGRLMLADGQESSCRVTNISPGGMALTASICGEPGERVVAYVDHLGRIEGVIVRQFPNGFALSISSTMHK